MSGPTITYLVACLYRLQWVLLFLQFPGDRSLYAWSPLLTPDRLLGLKRFLPTLPQLCPDFRLDHLPLVHLGVISEESQHSRLSSGLLLHPHHLSTGASPLATLAPAASHKNFCQGNLTFYFSALLCCSENGVTFYPSSFRAKHLHLSLERFIYQTSFQRYIK